MRVLTNHPLQLFGARDEYPFAWTSFGPAAGHVIGDRTVPYDLPFDASRGSIHEVLALAGEPAPDAILLFWPDQEAIPRDLERVEVPVIGVFSDYNLSLALCTGLAPFFDLVLCDHSALPIFGRLPFARIEPWCQFSFRPDVHRPRTAVEGLEGLASGRDIDLAFLGNLNPVVQRDRLPFLERIMALGERYRVFVGSAQQGAPYASVLARSRIAFNRSVRGEVNLRCFEAAACGALLLCERENLEIRRYFREDEEVVLYGPHDLEDKICWLLEHESERARIADAGRRRVQDHRLAKHCNDVAQWIPALDPTRRPRADAVSVELGRATSMLLGRADATAILEAFLRCARAETSARTHNALAVAMMTRVGATMQQEALRLLGGARKLDPLHLPTLANLRRLRFLAGDLRGAAEIGTELAAHARASTSFADFEGLVLPLGFEARALSHAQAIAATLRGLDLEPLRAFFLRLATDEDPQGAMPLWSQAIDLRDAYATGTTRPVALSRSKV